MLPPVEDVHSFFNFVNAVLLGLGDIALRAIGLLTIIRFDWRRLIGHSKGKKKNGPDAPKKEDRNSGDDKTPEDRKEDDQKKPHAEHIDDMGSVPLAA